jgi:hypothetical protein
LALASCGDPLVDSGYRGVPFAHLQGDVTWGGYTDKPDPTSLRIALFFAPDPETSDAEKLLEATGSTTPVSGLPSFFVMNLFSLPTPDLLVHHPDGSLAGYGIARLMVYQDQNRNNRHDPGEPILGFEPASAYVYVPADLAAEQSPSHAPLAAGLYHTIVPHAEVCGVPPPPAPPAPPPGASETCGVPLGNPCNVDDDCQGGTCLVQSKTPWPAGYCVITEPPAHGPCRPSTGVYYASPQFAPRLPGVVGYYLKGCTQDTDCDRGIGDERIYACDPILRACVPLNGLSGPDGTSLPVGGGQKLEPFCADPLQPPPH